MEFYPPKYWGLDPIYHACVKLSIADILNLTEHPTCKGTYARIVQCATTPTFTVDAAIVSTVIIIVEIAQHYIVFFDCLHLSKTCLPVRYS